MASGILWPLLTDTRFFCKLLSDDVAAYGHNELDIEILAQGTQPNETELEVEKTIDSANDAGVAVAEIFAPVASTSAAQASPDDE